MSNNYIIFITRGKTVTIHWPPTKLRRQKSKKMGPLLCFTGFEEIYCENMSRSSRYIVIKEGYYKEVIGKATKRTQWGDPAKVAFIEDTLFR